MGLYYTTINEHTYELQQQPDGKFYYYDEELNIEVPVVFYTNALSETTNLDDIERFDHITKRDK